MLGIGSTSSLRDIILHVCYVTGSTQIFNFIRHINMCINILKPNSVLCSVLLCLMIKKTFSEFYIKQSIRNKPSLYFALTLTRSVSVCCVELCCVCHYIIEVFALLEDLFCLQQCLQTGNRRQSQYLLLMVC